MTEQEAKRRTRKVSREQALEAVRNSTSVSVEVTAVAIDKSVQTTRRAVEAGDIRAVRLDRNWSVLCGPLREQFGISDH